MSSWLQLCKHKGINTFYLTEGNNDQASCGENRIEWKTIKTNISFAEAFGMWKGGIDASYEVEKLFQSTVAEEPLFKPEEPKVATNKEKFQDMMEQKRKEGLVDFRPDIDVYAIAAKHLIGVKLVMVNYAPGFEMPTPTLDFTNSLATRSEVEESVYADLVAMMEAVDNGQTQVLKFNDSPRLEIECASDLDGRKFWFDNGENEDVASRLVFGTVRSAHQDGSLWMDIDPSYIIDPNQKTAPIGLKDLRNEDGSILRIFVKDLNWERVAIYKTV